MTQRRNKNNSELKRVLKRPASTIILKTVLSLRFIQHFQAEITCAHLLKCLTLCL